MTAATRPPAFRAPALHRSRCFVRLFLAPHDLSPNFISAACLSTFPCPLPRKSCFDAGVMVVRRRFVPSFVNTRTRMNPTRFCMQWLYASPQGVKFRCGERTALWTAVTCHRFAAERTCPRGGMRGCLWPPASLQKAPALASTFPAAAARSKTASQRLPEGGRSQQPIALERSAPTEPGTKQANYFTTGRITREAWLASCQMVLIAATPGSVMKWLMGAPVCGLGS